MKKLLYVVAVDGSEWSERATQRAVAIAKDTGAKVLLVNVTHWSGFRPLSPEHALHRPEERKAEEDYTQESVFGPLIEKHEDSGVDLEAYHTWGDPRDEIHNVVKRRHANMVFLGRRGRSTIRDLVVGSVANSVAHSTGVPIVLVP